MSARPFRTAAGTALSLCALGLCGGARSMKPLRSGRTPRWSTPSSHSRWPARWTA